MKGLGWAITAILYLVACLLLGGASAAGAAANAFLQLSGLAIIVVLAWRGGSAVPREARAPIWLAGLFLLLGLVTLVPLPASWWTGLPFRDGVADGFRLAAMQLPPLPLSLWPSATLSSLLAMIPPATLFLLVLRLPNEQRLLLLWALLAVAGLSIALGAFQLMGGRASPLRFYEITNAGAAVGFFANRNHQATLLLCALPFAGVLAARFTTRQGSRSKRSAGAIVSIAIALFLTTGIAIVASSAGYALFIPTALATMLIYRRAVHGRLGWGWPAALAALLLIFVVAGLRGPLSQEELSAEVSEDPASRRVIAATTMEAIEPSFPVGTGLGTFSTVYRLFENPNRVSHGYANHAHNDYLEIALETGLAGILLVLAFILWWGRQALRVWRRDFPGAGLARAGAVVIAVVLLHSIVDYPIRTAAIASLFALACALMAPAPGRRDDAASSEARGEALRHLEAE